jgi:hypothetical protein
MLHYIATQMIDGQRPYWDISGDKMLVREWIHFAVVRLARGSDLAWHLVDFEVPASIGAVLWLELSRSGHASGAFVAGVAAVYHSPADPTVWAGTIFGVASAATWVYGRVRD